MSQKQNSAQPPVVVQAASTEQLGPNPQTMTCPHCQTSITTRIEANPSTLTWLLGLGLCFFG